MYLDYLRVSRYIHMYFKKVLGYIHTVSLTDYLYLFLSRTRSYWIGPGHCLITIINN